MVSDTPDVENVILGENGVIEGIEPDAVVIDMSTISPQATRKSPPASKRNKRTCWMPRSAAEKAERLPAPYLSWSAGDAAILERCARYWRRWARQLPISVPRHGQTTKLMNQILVAGNLNAVCEALVFAQKQGVDLN